MLRIVMQTVTVSCLLCLLTSFVGCTDNTSASAPDSEPLTEPRAAEAGVGVKGQKTRQDTGITKVITGPVSALENVKQMAVFDLQIKPMVQSFRALEGRYPTNEEFMQNIIQANRLKLPELPEGSLYYFDSQLGQLMVYPEDQVPSK